MNVRWIAGRTAHQVIGFMAVPVLGEEKQLRHMAGRKSSEDTLSERRVRVGSGMRRGHQLEAPSNPMMDGTRSVRTTNVSAASWEKGGARETGREMRT